MQGKSGEMDNFLLSITLGEYIAAANARDFSVFFEVNGIKDLADSYKLIADDELRHFAMLKSVIKRRASMPTDIRSIYKGALLATPPTLSIQSIFERMAVMHTVFEGAAFAYMSLLAKFSFEEDSLLPIQHIAKIIMVDEARHMAEGFQAIDYMKRTMVSQDLLEKTKQCVYQNASALRELPARTIAGSDEFTARLYQSYDENVSKNIRIVYK